MAGEKILVVDDEPSILKFLDGFLKREGFEVYTLVDGLDIVNENQSIRPNVILLDVMLPGKDGFAVCKELRKVSNVPVIFLSAKDDTTNKILGLTLGADDYLTKPFDTVELLLRIKAVLRRTMDSENKGHDNNVLKFANLKIDLSSRRVEIENQEVNLTQKEFDLLSLLAKNPNRVFTRDQILEIIWDIDFYEDTGVVTTLVKRLREKINDDASSPLYIETVRGVGYRLGNKCRTR